MALHTPNLGLYIHNLARWGHAKKEVRNALDDAAATGLDVVPTTAGHRWGYIRCAVCGVTTSVWSTPRNAENDAKQLAHWMAKHHHEENR